MQKYNHTCNICLEGAIYIRRAQVILVARSCKYCVFCSWPQTSHVEDPRRLFRKEFPLIDVHFIRENVTGHAVCLNFDLDPVRGPTDEFYTEEISCNLVKKLTIRLMYIPANVSIRKPSTRLRRNFPVLLFVCHRTDWGNIGGWRVWKIRRGHLCTTRATPLGLYVSEAISIVNALSKLSVDGDIIIFVCQGKRCTFHSLSDLFWNFTLIVTMQYFCPPLKEYSLTCKQ